MLANRSSSLLSFNFFSCVHLRHSSSFVCSGGQFVKHSDSSQDSEALLINIQEFVYQLSHLRLSMSIFCSSFPHSHQIAEVMLR
ncbi:hypothetical protein KP509_18G006600 [Ceratopteris richardii]|uniref:Uncharacterized protein n=1 Tax=Ceratopteris richardii TaxID=49495 RepID=A0A8T2SPA4_CERRI|nr:hypothetical protein KP509_18G006600 [Ceratopteris richardii]